jgi:hypothetical protein
MGHGRNLMTHRKSVGVLCAILACIAGTAKAASWLEVGISKTGSKIALDVESLQRSNSKVSVWLKYDHTSDKSEQARESKQFVRYDCKARTVKIMSTIKYDATGTPVFSDDGAFANETPVIPESIGDFVFKVVCEGYTD